MLGAKLSLYHYSVNGVNGTATLSIPNDGRTLTGLYVATFPSLSGRIILFVVTLEIIEIIHKSNGLSSSITITRSGRDIIFTEVSSQRIEIEKL